jgi:hypothetical protein
MEASVQDPRSVRAAKNQSLFRAVNEELEGLEKSWQLENLDLICECAALDCDARIPLAVAEYHAVRAHPRRFFVAPGHEVPDVERTTERNDRYLVVEKLGEGGEFAERHAPRRDG